jgi:hypothetical protein
MKAIRVHTYGDPEVMGLEHVDEPEPGAGQVLVRVGSSVRVTLEIEAGIPDGAPDNVVRTVTENSRTLKFTGSGFEKE